MAEFQRPKGQFVFNFGGMSLRDRPDMLAPNKYPLAVNVRAYSATDVRTRPGLSEIFTTGFINQAVTDMRAYAALQTDDLPRILTRNADDTVWLDTGTQVGTLAGTGQSAGASMIPFRPNQSPQPWMYIANGKDYQKFSAPSSTNVVTQQRAGIVEPQVAPDAGIFSYSEGLFSLGSWTAAGTAGAVTGGNRVNDSITVRVNDPNGLLRNTSYQVPSTSSYQTGMNVIVGFSGGGSIETTILDVFSGNPTAIQISAIHYFVGATGRCIIVASYLGGGPGIGDLPIDSQLTLTSLRRGALLQIGAEVLYVWSATPGPDGSVAIETSTAGAYTTANTFTMLPSVSMTVRGSALHPVTSISDADFLSAVTTGIGTLTATPAQNPFVNSALPFRSEDYITIGIKVDTPTNLTEIKLLIDVDDGTFTRNFYYYAIRPSDISQAVANAVTQVAALQNVARLSAIDAEEAAIDSGELVTDSGAQAAPGANQWSQITFNISQFTRVGSDQTKSLQTITKVQLLVNCSGTVNLAWDVPVVVGGFSPDVGDVGAPYLYRIRPRSSVTGVKGNPSPETRYGVNPRRQSVFVVLPSIFPDPQMDTWDIFRYGGSVTSWRYVGSSTLNTSILGWGVGFLDIFDDAAANAGDELEFDNFEPWPSVDVPNNGPLVSLTGTVAVVTSVDPDIVQYLPGTQVILNGQNAYTLQTRPTLIAGNNYLLQFVENAGILTGTITNSTFLIQEPLIARQFLPYMWGPDASGTVFAVGDPLRPGTVYFSKNNAPDAAPDTYNVEITPPSEPLLGGEIVDGLSYVASSRRWWALYPQPDNPIQRYNFVEQPFTRGLAAPFGHCTDGKRVFYWAKDGIYANDQSLTDADLYQLFPHEGVAGRPYTYQNYTIFPPDYSQVAKFRLAYSNGYLYATYTISGGNYGPTLVLDTRTGAWSIDIYTGAASCFYSVEQQASSGPPSSAALNPVLLVAHSITSAQSQSSIAKQQDLTNDVTSNGSFAITCALATFEFDGGDKRAPKQWGDAFLDCRPASASNQLTVNPTSLGAPISPTITVPTNANRTRTPLAINFVTTVVSDFLGMYFQWTDDFTQQSVVTVFYLWQPSYVIQPAYEISWQSFGTSFGLKGYVHLRQISVAWVSTAQITLTTSQFDGQPPAQVMLPSSNGAYIKITFPFSANKGMLYRFSATSSAPFQIFDDDSELYVGEWGREGPYAILRGFGGRVEDDAPI